MENLNEFALKADWMHQSSTSKQKYIKRAKMGWISKLRSAKKVMDTVPRVDEPMNLVLFIVNIILPGKFSCILFISRYWYYYWCCYDKG